METFVAFGAFAIFAVAAIRLALGFRRLERLYRERVNSTMPWVTLDFRGRWLAVLRRPQPDPDVEDARRQCWRSIREAGAAYLLVIAAMFLSPLLPD